MKGKIWRTGRPGPLIGLTLTLWLFSLVHLSVAEVNLPADPCEAEALRAYVRALKICELAQEPNPRLRCYEAARKVYVQTLQDCRRNPKP